MARSHPRWPRAELAAAGLNYTAWQIARVAPILRGGAAVEDLRAAWPTVDEMEENASRGGAAFSQDDDSFVSATPPRPAPGSAGWPARRHSYPSSQPLGPLALWIRANRVLGVAAIAGPRVDVHNLPAPPRPAHLGGSRENVRFLGATRRQQQPCQPMIHMQS